jgi:ferredoxin
MHGIFIPLNIDGAHDVWRLFVSTVSTYKYHPPVTREWICMNVTIDRATCVSCGSCWEACPGFFEQDPNDSFSRIIEKYRINENIAQGTPTGDLEACAQDASELCPVQIISIKT